MSSGEISSITFTPPNIRGSITGVAPSPRSRRVDAGPLLHAGWIHDPPRALFIRELRERPGVLVLGDPDHESLVHDAHHEVGVKLVNEFEVKGGDVGKG